MHQLLAEQYVASIKRRASQGDCPTEAPLSVEALEDLALTLDALSSIPAQGVGVKLADNGLTAAIVEDMRVKYSGNPAMPFAHRVAFSNICDAALAALSSPSQPAAVAVTDEMVEAIVQAVRPYTHRTLFLDEHRDLVRAALRSTP